MALNNISPIDGRYQKVTSTLIPYFSEAALFRYRCLVEIEYFIALSEAGETALRKFNEDEKELLQNIYDKFSEYDASVISLFETSGYKDIPATNHDVKAVEYFIKDKLSETSLKDCLEWIHFGLTSEDVNNLAYSLMFSESLDKVLLPNVDTIINRLTALAGKHSALSMLARTHGQSASPTTFGKEFKVFAERLKRQRDKLHATKVLAKLNGATGNYDAHVAAYPKVDWIKFSQDFIASLNSRLEANLFTTQIEPHDSLIDIFDSLKHINSILLDFNQDIWRYISDEWVVQKTVEGEIGSSAMPHKVNPIKFENSEGNLSIANSLLEFFARKLPISRMQRDLSDSTVQRNIGTALAHCLVGYHYLLGGLDRIAVNEAKVKEELKNHVEVIAEGIQTVLRREGVAMPYEKLKNLTRGKKVTLQDFHKFIDDLEVSEKIKEELKAITPENYIGLSEKLSNL